MNFPFPTHLFLPTWLVITAVQGLGAPTEKGAAIELKLYAGVPTIPLYGKLPSANWIVGHAQDKLPHNYRGSALIGQLGVGTPRM
jgi:hypothetical protein